MDWEANWKQIVKERATLAGTHANPGYWDRRAASFARSTKARVDQFLAVIDPYASPQKTLIDAGAGTGRHAIPLSERLEWVTAVEPSEGMRAQIPARDNMTIIASTWEDAEVAPADLVICSHVLYGVEDPVGFITKLDVSARERVFVVLRESELPHPSAAIRKRLLGEAGPRMPRFSELFMLLVQMGIAPDVAFLRYRSVTRYADLDEAVTDTRAMVGDAWDEATGRAMLEEMLTPDGEELVFDGEMVVAGVAHWQPRART
ncbi:MAG TPA: methyltransferase domain-containing protein [Candidatus Dormibacteraeota bacterium]|nr:methyltransferase domain-containing protein [Candidatus Dormibacteraeota bacterium]